MLLLFSCFLVLHFVAWSCVLLSCASLDPNVLSGAITRLCCVADLHSLRHGTKVLKEGRGRKSVDWAVANFQWKSMEIPEICPGKMQRHIDWLRHCNIRDNCDIRGLIRPAKSWWRVFLGFLGWLSHPKIAPPVTNSKTYSWWCHMMPFLSFLCFGAFISLFLFVSDRSKHTAVPHLIWPKTSMHTHLSLLVAELVLRASKSIQKQHLYTSHALQKWTVLQDAYTFGLKFGLWPKGSWKKLCLATVQSSWCRFGSWMNFQCSCFAYEQRKTSTYSIHTYRPGIQSATCDLESFSGIFWVSFESSWVLDSGNTGLWVVEQGKKHLS